LYSLPENFNLSTFQETAAEVVAILTDGQGVVGFPSEEEFAMAVDCFVIDSLEPARQAGPKILNAVGQIFGYRPHQLLPR